MALTARLSPPQSRHQKRARAQAQLRNLEAYAAQPHSFVFARGRAGRGVRQLSLDLRRVMEPLTATRLQVCTTHSAYISRGPGLRGCGGGFNRGTPRGLSLGWRKGALWGGSIVSATQGCVGQRMNALSWGLAECLRLVV